MKHDWKDVTPTTVREVCEHGWESRRQCRNCGAIQTREAIHEWMRVVGYRWVPLVGRCKTPRRKKVKRG